MHASSIGRTATSPLIFKASTLASLIIAVAMLSSSIVFSEPGGRRWCDVHRHQAYDEGPNGRFGGQQKARALIVEHPLGIGTGTFGETYHHEEAHNVYLSMFLNAGWIGGVLYVISVFVTLYLGFRSAMRPGPCKVPRSSTRRRLRVSHLRASCSTATTGVTSSLWQD